MTALFPPIAIFLWGIGGGFALPLLYRLGKPWLHGGFVLALLGLTLSSLVPFAQILMGEGAFDILTAGAEPPVSINLRLGLHEGAATAATNVAACLLAISLWERIRGGYVWMLLFLIVVMGINGMILTRDLFNLFVFLEIVSIGTYGLLAMGTGRPAVEAAMKYVLATVIASLLFLLGAALVYQATGRLNIDLLLGDPPALSGTIAGAGVMMLLACLMLELKPWPANGWALDVYETAPAPLAAFLSVCTSAGMIFAFWKLLPLFDAHLDLVVASAAITYLLSNVIGLRQTDVQRLLGYSSIGQMALLTLAIAALSRTGTDEGVGLIAFGLFVNHMLAKAGLFCCADLFGARRTMDGLRTPDRRLALCLLTLFIIAISALPPFPGFWAKWELILRLAAEGDVVLIAIILAGSLLEAAYLFRWLIRCYASAHDGCEAEAAPTLARIPPLVFAALLVFAGAAGAVASGADLALVLLPAALGAAFVVFAPLPTLARGAAMLAAVLVGAQLMPEAAGLAGLFADLLLAGGLVIAAAVLHRPAAGPAFHPLIAFLLLSVQALTRARTGLEFYVAWEFVTIASFLLISGGRRAKPELLRFLVFSLLAAFLLLGGFALLTAQSGTTELSALRAAGPDAGLAIALMAAGLLVKAAAYGVHVWLPGAYAEAPDEVTALLSAVVSKTAIFGLLLGGYAVLGSQAEIDFGRTLAWIGMITTVAGALFALAQDDAKRLLAFSSMSQLGYIVTAIGLMSHLGWVTALYLVASHMMVKGILFLALAGVILRTGTRRLDELGGLWRRMPLTAAAAAVALLSMSGLPPLMGFGAKWLLLSAIAEKGWWELAALGVLATFVGLCYMLRLFAATFLGRASEGTTRAREAPFFLLAPKALLLVGILVLSLFPKLLMEPVSAAIDPQFAATLVWAGQSLETIYGLWDPAPIMLAAIAPSAVLAGLVWAGARLAGGAARPLEALTKRPLPEAVVPPLVRTGWQAVGVGTHRLADAARAVYTGDGQLYAQLVLLYFLALYFGAQLTSAV